MQRVLRKLLNIQPGEGRKLAVLYVVGFVIATSLVWGGAIGRGLFLKRVGIEWLPLMFIFDALLTLPVTLIYAAVVDRVSNARLLAVIFGGVGLLLLTCWGLLLIHEQVTPIPYVIVVFALFYLAERVLRSLFSIHAWTFFNDYLDIRAAKRIFPILGTTSRVAGIAAGSLVALMANFLSAQNLVLAWVGVLAVGVWLALSTPRWLAADRQAAPSRPPSASKASLGGYLDNLHEGFRFVSGSTFLKMLAVGAFAMTALLVLMDFQAQQVFTRTFSTAEDLVRFYGLVETLLNLVVLPVQLLLVSRLVAWLGVAQVNLVFPVGSLLIYGALSFAPSLSSAVGGQFARDTFRTSVQGPVDNMLYNALPLPVKGRARAFVKGLLLPLATVAVGLVLLPMPQTGTLPWWILGIGGVAALVQVIAALLVRRQYTQALVSMLEAEDFSAYRLAGSELGPPDPATFRRLLARLRASQDEDSILFLSQIVAQVGGRGAGAQLVEVAEGASPTVQADILETLVETDTLDASALDLSRRALHAENARLRRAAFAAMEQLLGSGNPELWNLAMPLLDDPDPETRLPAVLLLVRSGDFFYLADAVRSLHELLDDEADPERRAAGLRALQAIGDARLVRKLAGYLDDPHDSVRLQTALVVESLADPEAPEWAVALARQAVARQLDDPVEGVRLSALHTLGKLGGPEALDRLLAALADPSDLVREQAGQGLLNLGADSAPALEALLDEEAATESATPERVRLSAAVVLGQMARDHLVGPADAQRYTRRVEDLFDDTLRRIYADLDLIAALDKLRPAPALARPVEPAPPSPAPSAEPSGLDALAALGRRGRAARRDTTARPQPAAAAPANGSAGPASVLAGPGQAKALLLDGLSQRNERRLEAAFRLLSASLRDASSSAEVIARNLQEPEGRGQLRASALEALESLTSPRLARLVGQLTPPGTTPVKELLASGQQEWDLEPLAPDQALETLLRDPDRWLAAIGIVMVAQERAIEPQRVQETWLSLWQADPNPAVPEAARYAARLLGLETNMEDTTELPTLDTLSSVEKALFLKQVPFFASMTVDQLRTLASIAEEQYYGVGDVIFAEGAPGEAIYVLVSGRVGIEREPKQGRVQRLDTLSSRQYFGERTIFDGARHENRAVALDRVHLLAIRRDPLLTLIRRAPDLSLSLVTILSQRLREADATLASRTRVKPEQVMRLYDRLTGEE
jgi:CRP-like cAMP-binding protein/HEAT repeat protein